MGHKTTIYNDGDRESILAKCQERIQYTFEDPTLLLAALTHASGADHRLASNERLEFFGDAILGYVICEKLFHEFPDCLEGELTRIKSVVVSRQTCAIASKEMNLQEFLLLGKGMAIHGHIPDSLMADVFESLVAAIYLDSGRKTASEFILRHLEPYISKVAAGQSGDNYKSQLQQLAQQEYARTPTYSLIDEKGPDHSKCFQVAAQIGKVAYEPAWGRNKKEAEQRAAHNALTELLNVLNNGSPSVPTPNNSPNPVF